MNPWSRRHLSFNLGFPNEYDAAQGRTGSALMIHGGCDSIGCYALTDELVEEIYLLVEASIKGGAAVPVHIFPFRMHPLNMHTHQSAPWLPFWLNLKDGYDAFETTKIPPKISVSSGQNGVRYVFDTPRRSSTQF
jgi:murein L,D-transpeptidase YafK